ncbi:MAG: 2-hydroxyacyl-CoA dehydratase, partial [Calditrichaeota bacterium]|nr:2-hydroxyacyl-CoA dehydratase [Calditrichota bacterium]
MSYEANNNNLKYFTQLETDYLSSTPKPLVGYLCLRTPVELIEAYGAVPVRITAQDGVQTEGYTPIRTDACSFCRSVPDLMNTEPYKRLNAVIAGACCDQMRRLTETLGDTLNIPVIFYGAPRTWNSDKSYFLGEMRDAFEALGKVIGTKLNEVELKRYIESRNTLRERINQMRESDELPSLLLHRIAASSLTADRIIDFLNKSELEQDEVTGIRLMLLGSIPSGKEITLIEESGAQVVADATCMGDRAFTLPESLHRDPFEFLYMYYIEDNLCPHRRPYDRLIDYVKEMIISRRVDGVVYRSVKYCHPFGLAATRFKSELDMPFLQLDDDLTLQATSSLKTRIGAFVEMLEA